MSTKDKILTESLSLFSQKGYQAVSMRDIAKSVGIQAPSLYKHFLHKEDLAEGIVTWCNQHYLQKMQSLNLEGSSPLVDIPLIQSFDYSALLVLGQQIFSIFIDDDILLNYRKWLSIDQYQNESFASLYNSFYFDQPLAYQSTLFATLFNLNETQSYSLALQFYSPIYTLICLCDRTPKRQKEAKLRITQHLENFIERNPF